MTVYGFVNRAGIVEACNSMQIKDPVQVQALADSGITIIELPDGTQPRSGIVIDGVYYSHAEDKGPPIPHIFIQYVAAQINSGAISASAFHPTTIAEMNDALSTAKMTSVAVSVQPVAP